MVVVSDALDHLFRSLLDAEMDFSVKLDRPSDTRLFIEVPLRAFVDFTRMGEIQTFVTANSSGLTRVNDGILTIIWFLDNSDEKS